MKTAIIAGAGGFIGNHLVRYLKTKGYHVKGIDIRLPAFSKSEADVFFTGDLRSQDFVKEVINEPFDELYQMATDMGGAGYVFSGDRDAAIMFNSTSINLNLLKRCSEVGVKKVFYPSSACVYPESSNSNYKEADAYPAQPINEYGWEKLYSERLYATFARSHGFEAKTARFHTIFGPGEAYKGGREKAPAAIARKVIEAADNSEIEIWGDGKQTRSFLYIDECIKGIYKLMQAEDFDGPVNIGSDHEISINELADIYIRFSGKNLAIRHVDGPQGPRNRNSDSSLIQKKLGWKPDSSTEDGLKKLYDWINADINKT